MRSITTLVLLAAVAGASAPAFADDISPAPAEPAKAAEWLDDFDKAAAVAKTQKKDLLVDFTGSGWCGWCTRLHDEVFAQPEFATEAPKGYVLVKLDFTAMGEPQNAPNPTRNKELLAKYPIEGYPTVLVVSPDGDVIAKMGYEKGGAKPWLEHLATASAKGREAGAAATALEAEFAATAADQTAARAAVVEKAVARLDDAVAAGGPTAKLAAIVRHGLELDADGKSGLAAKSLKALFAAGQSQAQDGDLAKKLDAKNEAGLLEHALLARLKRLGPMLNSDEAVAAHKADVEAFVADSRALAATGNLKNPDVYVASLATACNMAKQLLNDDAAAKEIAKVLSEKGPKDNERLTGFLKQFLGDDAKAPPVEKK